MNDNSFIRLGETKAVQHALRIMVHQMVRVLIANGTDLSNERAVILTLVSNGFRADDIARSVDAAIEEAKRCT